MKKIVTVIAAVLMTVGLTATPASATTTTAAPCEFWLPGAVCEALHNSDETVQKTKDYVVATMDQAYATIRCVVTTGSPEC